MRGTQGTDIWIDPDPDPNQGPGPNCGMHNTIEALEV